MHCCLCLLGLAEFVIAIVHPGGFEGQIGWFFVLLPGVVPASLLADAAYLHAPGVEPGIYWTLFVVFNFSWYGGIGYLFIKCYRVFA